MKNKTCFFQTFDYTDHGWKWNGYPVEILSGTEVEINDKNLI